MEKKKQLTVGELIERLKGFDPDKPVVLEGCDCEGDCDGVEERSTEILLTRKY